MKKLQITRSSPDHDDLVELYKKERKSKLKERYQALYLMIEIQNCTKVAELIKKSRNTVQTWVNLFNEGGLETIAPESPPGRPSGLSDEQKEELKADVMTHPRELGYDFSNWEGKSVAEHVRVKFGVSFTVRNAQKLLHALGFTLQRPKYKFPKADLEKQEEFIRDLKKNWILLDQTT
jgi:transposase